MAEMMSNSRGLGDYLSRAFNGHKIAQRPSDGYINATDMCKVKKGKLLADWRRNKDTQAFIDALSFNMGIPILKLVISVVGGDRSGTWIHPKAAIHLAMWLNAHFAVQVISWTSRFISGDLTLVHDLVERHEAVNTGTKVLATVTTAGADTTREAHELLHQDNAIEQENEQLKVRIAQVVKDAASGELTLVEIKRQLLQVTQDLATEKDRCEGLASDSRALRESAQEMNDELERLEVEQSELRTENNLKKRRLSETQSELDRTTCMGRVLYQHYLSNRGDLEQLATAEQLDGLDPLSAPDHPGLGSKPTRYIALKNVTGRSCGRKDRLLRDLNRDTFDSVGQNFTRWSLACEPSRRQKFSALASIVDCTVDSDRYRTPFSSVSWRCLVYSVFKTKYALEYSTWATLQDMLYLSARSNAWFSGRSFSLDFQLTQQKDLERVLGLSYHPALSMPAPQPDIRRWLTNMTPERALMIEQQQAS